MPKYRCKPKKVEITDRYEKTETYHTNKVQSLTSTSTTYDCEDYGNISGILDTTSCSSGNEETSAYSDFINIKTESIEEAVKYEISKQLESYRNLQSPMADISLPDFLTGFNKSSKRGKTSKL
ncbi:unnamed protein product [Dimorphilus gyrociliatus]|uniref:Uncharacterized protein n=1 Tax=Dimorphilus gyrociliatus TaxID=2664684 RepID=A0A7I8VQ71_9ANNE|nr:unnamed protein product [Dimorphilus gyrociliatus]